MGSSLTVFTNASEELMSGETLRDNQPHLVSSPFKGYLTPNALF